MTKKERKSIVLIGVVLLLFIISIFYNFYEKKYSNNKTETGGIINDKKDNNKKKENISTIGKNSETEKVIAFSSYSICLENTKDGPNAKDCCDCLDVDLSIRKACRDATVNYDFSENTVFKSFEIPSTLGADGDYSAYTISGDQQKCKEKCEATTTTLVCGDFQYCRTACNQLSQQ